MENIKFRVFDPESKKIEQVGALDWDHTCNSIITCNTTTQKLYNGYHKSFDFILMQYTNLKDRTGKEIYEGDVVRIGYTRDNYVFDNIGYVYYSIDRAMFYIAELRKEQFNIGSITKNTINGKDKIFEIIGNIYQNPELLK